MRVIQRYFTSEITRSVLFALAAFLALFAFFEMMGQLEQVGRNGYKLQQAVFYVLMGLPGNVYELMPTAVLIGTIYTLSQLAARSNSPSCASPACLPAWRPRCSAHRWALRCSPSFWRADRAQGRMGGKLKLQAQGASMSSQFRSGMWAKDVIKDKGLEGNVTGSRFINIQTVQPDGRIEGVKLYELDTDFHMARMVTAKSGMYEGNHQWVLNEVVQSDFTGGGNRKITEPVKTVKIPQMKLVSEVTPEILSVLFADPDRMSAYDLLAYTKHLEANNQRTDRYEIAFWKKIVYPLSIFVMLALALPFAYLHFRAGV
jgi:lipopolysaccharide export system permease protein